MFCTHLMVSVLLLANLQGPESAARNVEPSQTVTSAADPETLTETGLQVESDGLA